MRLVALAVLAGWLVAWGVAPRGAPVKSTSIVGAVACAGGDQAAAAWLELRRGDAQGRLHVVTLDAEDRIGEHLVLPAASDATGFRLVEAGPGRFVLAAEHRDPARHWYEVYRLGGGREEVLPRVVAPMSGASWRLQAAGDEIAIVTEADPEAPGLAVAHTLTADGAWQTTTADRILIGAGAGHLVRYEERRGQARLWVAPERPSAWTAELGHGLCLPPGAEVVSVAGLRGGYARLVRSGAQACVEGIRDGAPFVHRRISLEGFTAPRLTVDDRGELSIEEEQEAQLFHRRWRIPEESGKTPELETTPIHPALDHEGIRYRLFAGEGALGRTDLATNLQRGEIQVMLERQGAGRVQLLAPARHYEPDYRPVLRRLAPVPLILLLISLLDALRMYRRLRTLTPAPADRALLARGGQGTLQGTLMVDGDAPVSGAAPMARDGASPLGMLRLRCGRDLVTVFLEGARVVRASAVRPASQPRGDAVDVAAGASVVATGRLEPGELYRDEARLRAGRSDLVVVGASAAEVKHFALRAVRLSFVLLSAATTLVALLVH